VDKVRVGVIGTGVIAGHHVSGYQHSGKAEVVAAADINPEALSRFCDKFGVERRFADYRGLLALEDVDAVSVCLPVFLHGPVSVEALRAGKHVLCEKPMACNVAEAEQMVATARETGLKLQIHYRYRFTKNAREARRIIERGDLGKVYFARVIGHRFRGRAVLDSQGLGRWFIDPKLAGGGALFDLGGYSLDLVFWLLGFPKLRSVCASTYQEIDKDRARAEGFNVDELGIGMIRLEDGGTVWLERSTALNTDPAKIGSTEIYGDRAGLRLGPLTLYQPDANGKLKATRIETPPEDAQRPVHMIPPKLFVEAILEDKPVPDCSGEEGLYVQRILNAMLESAQQAREVSLS